MNILVLLGQFDDILKFLAILNQQQDNSYENELNNTYYSLMEINLYVIKNYI